jgi:glycolate oxidase iron-sulfur subunit
MQTSFSADQLQDPDISTSNQVLRTCVHCGFCTATCPTFVLLGDELDSPRGRIYLIKDMLESGRAATEDVVRHVDRCLGCFACMTTCPSGVHYMHLVDHARTHIENTYRRRWHDSGLRWVLAHVLPSPTLFRLSLVFARLGSVAMPLLPRSSLPWRRVRAMLALAPKQVAPPSDSARPGVHRAQGTRRGRVALLTGCAQTVLAPSINEATIRLLTRLGIEVVVAEGVTCCGALTHHMGLHAAAMATAARAIDGWHREMAAGGLDAVVINTSGCGTVVKDYGHLFRAAPAPWPEKAASVSDMAMDISSYLETIGYAATRKPPGLRVAYHAACSLQHGQKITAAPKNLLRAAGFEVVEPRDAHLCCGSAGTYNIMQPDIADRLRARKLETIDVLQPDVIAAGNIGCLTQLGGAIPAVHTVELLDWMAGGPVPANLAAARAA